MKFAVCKFYRATSLSLQETVLPEKFGELIKAKARLERHAKDARCAEDRQIAQSLASMFERTNRYDNLDVVTLTMQ